MTTKYLSKGGSLIHLVWVFVCCSVTFMVSLVFLFPQFRYFSWFTFVLFLYAFFLYFIYHNMFFHEQFYRSYEYDVKSADTLQRSFSVDLFQLLYSIVTVFDQTRLLDKRANMVRFISSRIFSSFDLHKFFIMLFKVTIF